MLIRILEDFTVNIGQEGIKYFLEYEIPAPFWKPFSKPKSVKIWVYSKNELNDLLRLIAIARGQSCNSIETEIGNHKITFKK